MPSPTPRQDVFERDNFERENPVPGSGRPLRARGAHRRPAAGPGWRHAVAVLAALAALAVFATVTQPWQPTSTRGTAQSTQTSPAAPRLPHDAATAGPTT